ncbi:MAG: hypothetical protein M1829_000344 [Trizodia sp. TS-e1964]|nr:MAG: hypothetical protein M1829_000344 [Trizodia sp. TS-e1964]
MPFGWGESHEAYQVVNNSDDGELPHHEAHKSHELVAGAAAFEGFRLFEQHQESEGKPVSHAFAKEMLAGFAAAEVDKLAETKGLDAYDRREAHKKARENTDNMYDQQYGNDDQYDPRAQNSRANEYLENNRNDN